MDRSEIFSVARRLLHHLEQGTTDSDTRGPLRVPAATYTDAAAFETERREIFGRAPQLLCMSRDLPEAGDYLTHDLLGVPIVAIRGRDGRARTFVNACTHRAARLVEDRGNLGTGAVCPYHAWRFDLEGKLAAVNAQATFGPVDRNLHGLRELPSVERHGFLFASLGPEPDLDAHLGDLGAQLAFFELDRCEPVARGRFEVRANWKLSESN